jgi:hypothetical protein
VLRLLYDSYVGSTEIGRPNLLSRPTASCTRARLEQNPNVTLIDVQAEAIGDCCAFHVSTL